MTQDREQVLRRQIHSSIEKNAWGIKQGQANGVRIFKHVDEIIKIIKEYEKSMEKPGDVNHS